MHHFIHLPSQLMAIGLFLFGWQPVTAQERPVSSGYPTNDMSITFQWGDLSYELERWATPYYYKGEVNIPKDQLPALLQSPMQFFKNGKPFWIKGLDVQAIVNKENHAVMTQDTTGRFPARFMHAMGSKHVALDSFMEQRALMFTIETQRYLLENMVEGDHFAFSNFVDRSSGLVINSLNVTIENPWKEFTPRFFIAYVKYDLDDLASWQLVNLQGKKQILRYDPMDTMNLKIRKIYADPEKYIQVPINAFRTVNRYVSETDYVVPPSKAETIDTILQPFLDPFDRLDLLTDPTSILSIHWGEIVANNSGYYYKPDEFYGKTNAPMEVHIDDKVLSIRQVRISIVPVQGPIEQLFLDGRYPEKWADRLNQIPSKSSIYFDEIIVDDISGQVKLLPLQFMFNLL